MSNGDQAPEINDARMLAVVRRHVDELESEFDTVQIFVTKYDPKSGYTHGVKMGVGNYYARVGYCRDWIAANDNNAGVPDDDDVDEEVDDD